MKNSAMKRIGLNARHSSALKQCVLMQPLDEEAFSNLIQNSHVLELTENNILFQQGEELTDIYLLISGGIKLQRLAPNGDEKVIEIIKPGQTFAEAVLFLGRSQYPVSAVTLSHSVMISIHAETYLNLVKTSNALCLNLLGKLSQRLHWMVNEVDRLTLHNATFRVIDYLLSQIVEGDSSRTGVSLEAPKHVIGISFINQT